MCGYLLLLALVGVASYDGGRYYLFEPAVPLEVWEKLAAGAAARARLQRLEASTQRLP